MTEGAKQKIRSSKPLVSIIVPAYNSEATIMRCLNSLASQTYSNIEILLINDGSVDSTGSLCHAFCKDYPNTIVIDQDNCGQARARNKGLDLATGEFVMFCDSDDFVSSRIVEYLVKAALRTGADFVECNYCVCVDDVDKCRSRIDSVNEAECDLIVDSDSTVEFFLDYRLFTTAPWGKLYSKKLFDNVRFPEWLKKGEDDALIASLAEKVSRYSRINLPLYAYCIRDNSVMTSGYSQSDLLLMRMFEQRVVYYGEKYGDDIKLILEYRYLLFLNELFACYSKQMRDVDVRLVARKRRELMRHFLRFPGSKRKIVSIVGTLFPKIMHRVKKVLAGGEEKY